MTLKKILCPRLKQVIARVHFFMGSSCFRVLKNTSWGLIWQCDLLCHEYIMMPHILLKQINVVDFSIEVF